MPTPRRLPISVVIPAYNRARLLPRAIDSVLGQRGHEVAEIIVVDDASTDESALVADRMGVTVLRLPVNGGAGKARSAGVEAASEQWLAFLDSDDAWRPNLLETLWPLTPGRNLVCGATLTWLPNGSRSYSGIASRNVREIRSPAALYPDNFVAASGSLVRRDVVLDVGGIRTELRYAEDLDLWLRVIATGPAAATPSPVVNYYVHAGQKSQGDASKETQQQIAYDYRGAPWWSPRLPEYNRAFRAWDAGRHALRQGDRATAVHELRTLVGNRHRLVGIAKLLGHRALMRRRQRSYDEHGAPTTWQWRRGVLPLIGVMRRPPHTVVVSHRWQKWLVERLAWPAIGQWRRE